ncbi:hypothetical protein OROGR_032260 [Orobanche gracilis]
MASLQSFFLPRQPMASVPGFSLQMHCTSKVWKRKFDALRTFYYDFRSLNGTRVKVPFMTSKKKTQYIRAFDGFKVLRLFYKQGRDKNCRFSMCIFLPDQKDGLPDLIGKLASESGFLRGKLPRRKVRVCNFRIPKFKISFTLEASNVLKELGVGSPFSQREANFTKMVDSGKLFVERIFHKASIEVNEEGTQVTAANLVQLQPLCATAGTGIDFIADHPFLFLIQEDLTGTILFMGQMLNPLDGAAMSAKDLGKHNLLMLSVFPFSDKELVMRDSPIRGGILQRTSLARGPRGHILIPYKFKGRNHKRVNRSSGYETGRSTLRALLITCVDDLAQILELKRVVKARYGFQDNEILILANESGYMKPTKFNIHREVRFLCREAERGELRYLHISAHANIVPAGRGAGQKWVYTSEHKWIQASFWNAIIGMIPAHVKLNVTMNTCFSGAFFTRANEVQEGRGQAVVLTACGPDDEVYALGISSRTDSIARSSPANELSEFAAEAESRYGFWMRRSTCAATIPQRHHGWDTILQ